MEQSCFFISFFKFWVLDGSLCIWQEKKRGSLGTLMSAEKIIHTICNVVLLEPRAERVQAAPEVLFAELQWWEYNQKC